MPYVLLFIFLRDIPDLCPKGADLDVKPSAPSCPLTFLLCLGLPTEQAESQGTLPGGVASVLVEIQTVPTVVKTIRGFKKYIEAFWGLTLLYELTWKDTLYVLWQTLTWLESLSFGGSYYFWQWITWEKGREGTQNSPPAYWEPSSSHNIHFAGCIQCKHALRL